jgi:hypothetical protein
LILGSSSNRDFLNLYKAGIQPGSGEEYGYWRYQYLATVDRSGHRKQEDKPEQIEKSEGTTVEGEVTSKEKDKL